MQSTFCTEILCSKLFMNNGLLYNYILVILKESIITKVDWTNFIIETENIFIASYGNYY